MSYEDYLQHHGIPGMRWGRRNGPPYPLLRRSMSSAERKENPKSSDSIDRADDKKPLPNKTIKVETETGQRTNTKASSYRRMSDQELKDANNRLKDEQTYLTDTQKDITNGKKFVGALLATTGALAVTKFITTYVSTVSDGAAKKFGNETLKDIGPEIEKLFGKIRDFRAKHRSETND